MKISESDATARQVDAALKIIPLFDGRDFAFDIAKAVLSGTHPPVVNRVSDRIYYFLSGSAKVRVGAETYDAVAGDVVVIHAGQVHALNGTASYLVVTSPPFDPANESLVGDKDVND